MRHTPLWIDRPIIVPLHIKFFKTCCVSLIQTISRYNAKAFFSLYAKAFDELTAHIKLNKHHKNIVLRRIIINPTQVIEKLITVPRVIHPNIKILSNPTIQTPRNKQAK